MEILEIGENDVSGRRSLHPGSRNPNKAPLSFVPTSGSWQGGVAPSGVPPAWPRGPPAGRSARLQRVELDDLGVNRKIGNGRRRRALNRAEWRAGAAGSALLPRQRPEGRHAGVIGQLGRCLQA